MISLIITKRGSDVYQEIEKEIIPLLGSVYEILNVRFDGWSWILTLNYEVDLLLGAKIRWDHQRPLPVFVDENKFDSVMTVSLYDKPSGVALKSFFLQKFAKMVEPYTLIKPSSRITEVSSLWEEF